MNRYLTTCIFSALLVLTSVCRGQNPYALPDGLYTEIKTEAGLVVCELFYQQVPMTEQRKIKLKADALIDGPIFKLEKSASK